jgi:hypothetical protein
MTEREALKLALEAFGEIDWSNNSQWQSDRAKVAITAIKEALANEALEKMAENARELGLDYEPEQDWIERERAVGYREGHQNALKQMAQPEQEPVGEIVDAIEERLNVALQKCCLLAQSSTPPHHSASR